MTTEIAKNKAVWSHKLPGYLEDLYLRRNQVRLLTGFRLSGHKLLVEAGRYGGSEALEFSNRCCRLCKTGCVEDEKHVVFECPELLDLRTTEITKKTLDFSSGDVRCFMEQNAMCIARYLRACYQRFDGDSTSYSDVDDDSDAEMPTG